MKLILSVMLVISLSTLVSGTWALVPLDELVAESDLIIVGTLYSAAEDDEGIGHGYIMVDEIVWGRARTFPDRPLRVGDNLKIKWADNWACASGMHMRRANQKGVWLLDVAEDGTVSAAYPGKFAGLDQLSEIRRLLLKGKEKKPYAVDIYLGETPVAVHSGETRFVVDVAPSTDYPLVRAGITLLLATGFYWLLYRSRFRIR